MLVRIIRSICFLWFLFGLGIVLAVNGLSMSTFFDKTKGCTMPVTGTITVNERMDENIKRKNGGEGPQEPWTTYVLTTEYKSFKGDTITEIYMSEELAKRYPEGTSIELMYNPDEVTKVCVVGLDKPGSVIGNIMFFVGVAAMIAAPVGTVVMIVKAIRSRSES